MIRSKSTRYYVDQSSWFDTHPYRTVQIAAAVKRAGGFNVRTTYNYGWRNQPRVVTFSLPAGKTAQQVADEVGKAVGTQWIIIRQQDW